MTLRRFAVLVVTLLATAAAGCARDAAPSATAAGEPLLVAAASDLRPAFEELERSFREQTGTSVRYAFGSSGQLAQQLVNGAPFDLFASASAEYVDEVIDAGVADPATKQTYAYGRVVVWSPERSYELSDLAGDAVTRVAIANPGHAPYGRAAREALERSGRLEAVESKLVLAANVSDAQRLVRSGNAEAGIIARSLAVSLPGEWTPVPERLHDPLEQALVVTGEGERAALARRFAELLAGDEGRAILRRHGFVLPDERTATAQPGAG